MRLTVLFSCLVINFAISHVSSASISLSVGQVEIIVAPERSWTIETLSYAGKGLVDVKGSAQGTVLAVTGVGWVGSEHGKEVVRSVDIAVDGGPVALEDGGHYKGKTISFRRVTDLGTSMHLESTITIKGDCVDEKVTLKPTGDSGIAVCYGFLGSRSKRLSHYIGLDTEGKAVISNSSDRKDRVKTSLQNSFAVAQYDPINGDGLVTILTGGKDLKPEFFIWDRVEDNKLYCAFHALEGHPNSDAEFRIAQKLLFVSAPPDDWRGKAAQIVLANQSSSSAR